MNRTHIRIGNQIKHMHSNYSCYLRDTALLNVGEEFLEELGCGSGITQTFLLSVCVHVYWFVCVWCGVV